MDIILQLSLAFMDIHSDPWISMGIHAWNCYGFSLQGLLHTRKVYKKALLARKGVEKWYILRHV